MSRAFSLQCRLTRLKEKLTLAQATCRSDFQRSLIFIVFSLNSIVVTAVLIKPRSTVIGRLWRDFGKCQQ